MLRTLSTLLIAVAPLCLTACGSKQSQAPTRTIEPIVVATTGAHASLASRIADGAIDVVCILPPGTDAASWWPAEDDVRRLQSAQLILLNGFGLESWSSNIALPRSRVLDLSRSVRIEPIIMPGVTHSHGPDGDHSHDLENPYVWLDPALAIEQTRAIAERMSRAFPDSAEDFEANAAVVVAELSAIDQKLKALDLGGRPIAADGPQFDYVARRYCWSRTPSTNAIPLSQVPGIGVHFPTAEGCGTDLIDALNAAADGLADAVGG
ncbi:MAG: metal ABC transporter substrate-binding protein [Planctomycetota bacterium]